MNEVAKRDFGGRIIKQVANVDVGKCSICHKILPRQSLQTMHIYSGFALSVCKTKCMTPTIKEQLIAYFSMPKDCIEIY